jgi:hypothetical protein
MRSSVCTGKLAYRNLSFALYATCAAGSFAGRKSQSSLGMVEGELCGLAGCGKTTAFGQKFEERTAGAEAHGTFGALMYGLKPVPFIRDWLFRHG